jgi:hypothetical protein
MTKEPDGRRRESTIPIIRMPFIIRGAVIGLLFGLTVMAVTDFAGPSGPGRFEALLQLVLVGIMTAMGAFLGLVSGVMVGLFQRFS